MDELDGHRPLLPLSSLAHLRARHSLIPVDELELVVEVLLQPRLAPAKLCPVVEVVQQRVLARRGGEKVKRGLGIRVHLWCLLRLAKALGKRSLERGLDFDDQRGASFLVLVVHNLQRVEERGELRPEVAEEVVVIVQDHASEVRAQLLLVRLQPEKGLQDREDLWDRDASF